jgi:hypothetical protein
MYEVITKQRTDAESQKMQMEHEFEMAQAKARELSVQTAKAKVYAERAYNKFVTWGNRFCQDCSSGVKKIEERRQELKVQNSHASSFKAIRTAHTHIRTMRKENKLMKK